MSGPGSWFFPHTRNWSTEGQTFPWQDVTTGSLGSTIGKGSFTAGERGTMIWTSHKAPYNAQRDQGGMFGLTRIGWVDLEPFRYRKPIALFGGGFADDACQALPLNKPSWYSPPTPSVPAIDRGAIDVFGATAIARTLPTNPSFNLATFIGEGVQDGVPKTPGIELLRSRASQFHGKAGDEFLNVEFGWLPLVSDLRDFARTIKNVHSTLEQFRRDSGKIIRRRYVGTPTESVSVASGRWSLSPINIGIQADFNITRKDFSKKWFSGAFRYYIPVGDSQMEKFARAQAYANRILGVRMTPDTVWELAPWSWAVDWFTNAGDVIHNISSLGSDGLVMTYGYAMHHRHVSDAYVCRIDPRTFGASAGTSYAKATYVAETKARQQANPYGFGVDDTSLTKVQLAILAALGLSKGTRTG